MPLYDDPPSTQETKQSKLQLIASLGGIATVLLAILTRFPLVGIVAACIVAVVLTFPYLREWTKSAVRFFKRRSFIKRQHRKLQELLKGFVPFAADNSGRRSMIEIIRSVSSNRSDEIERIQPSKYIAAWTQAFGQQLAFPTSDIHVFMTRCEEFACIVFQFNCDYVLKTQRAMELRDQIAEHNIDEFEQFREEFNAYLRNLEDWIAKLVEEWAKIEHEGRKFGVPLRSNYDRLKPFRKVAAAKA
jgi:type III secretory pathway component EscV